MYYLFFKRYDEYNQFEGFDSWELGMATFNCLETAKDRREDLLNNRNYCDISEVLTEVK